MYLSILFAHILCIWIIISLPCLSWLCLFLVNLSVFWCLFIVSLFIFSPLSFRHVPMFTYYVEYEVLAYESTFFLCGYDFWILVYEMNFFWGLSVYSMVNFDPPADLFTCSSLILFITNQHYAQFNL